jgi:phenylacetic acid degradation operon negative regulatory protein
MRVGADPNLLVYSSLAAFGSRRGGALPGTWFLTALAPLGHSEAALRQTLRRMELAGELHSERVGRHKLYRLTPIAAEAVAAGAEKIHQDPPRAWDGRWSACIYQFASDDRARRDRLRDLLEVEGFAQIARGVMVHVRDKTARVAKAIAAMRPRPDVTLLRGASLVDERDDRLVARLWNTRDLARRYRRVLCRHGAPLPQRLEPARAFARRFALVVDFLDVAWDDPELPPELLPSDWPGDEARRIVRCRYDELLSGAIQHGDAVLRAVHAEDLVSLP